jgi:HD-GYP domain-containing protein (c-di-GMP phosphodiesterase class II)
VATNIAQQFVRAVQANHEYIPIHIGSLRVDSVTGFDLYLQLRPSEPVVLYAERNTPFTEKSRRRLLENNVEYVHISSSQQSEYRRYLEKHLVHILQDSNIDVEAKSEVLYASAHGLMRDIFENPELEGGLARSRDVVRCTIGFMYHNRTALRHLITAAASDYQLYTHAVNGFVFGLGLAWRAGLGTPRELAEFGAGALLRDLGMMKIPAAVRDHTGKLTVSQFEMLKRHTEMSEAAAQSLGGVGPVALDLIRHHHERLDGTGYPDGLVGSDIRPLVRVLTIADTFDALTTHRAHQAPMKSVDALRLMRSRMVAELDQDLLTVFIRMLGNPEVDAPRMAVGA